MDRPILWYFADPMCSWCWGFEHAGPRHLARQAGVRGFPALILQHDAQLQPISHGCQPLDAVRAALDRCLPSA